MKLQTSIFNIMNTPATTTLPPAQKAAEKNIVPKTTAASTPEAPEQKPLRRPVNRKVKPFMAGVTTGIDYGVIYQNLVTGLRKFFEKNGFKRCVLGVSGGVDSALTLKIAADSLGAKNVTAMVLPELGLTKQENIDHAKTLCDFLGVHYYYQPINNFLIDFRNTPWKETPKAHANTKARIRSVLIYNFANTENALVLGTSNKSELLLGYGTKYGDLAADVEVIGDLLKTEVVKVADYVGLPPEITNKTPTAELAAGQTDEADLGAPYSDLDKVLRIMDLGEEGCISRGLPPALVHIVFRRVEENKHKNLMPEVIKATL